MKVKVAQSCPTLCDSVDYSPWNSPGQNTEEGSLSLLQGIFPTQGLNLGLPHCRQILYQLSHKGKPIVPKKLALITTVALYSNFPYLPLLSAFNIFFLCFVYNSLIIEYLGACIFKILLGVLWDACICCLLPFINFRKFSATILFNISCSLFCHLL